MISREDMIKLIKVEDAINEIDNVMLNLWGSTHSPPGICMSLDYIFDVIRANSNMYYQMENDVAIDTFLEILNNKEIPPEERAIMLMKGDRETIIDW